MWRYIVLVGIIGIGLLLFFTRPYAEVSELSQTDWDTDTYTTYFGTLAREKGSEYAFEVLRRADLPTRINLHTIAHPIGAMLYREEGISGIQKCTDEFRSACAHAIVIQAFIEQGQSAFENILHACEKAPGGNAAYAMCIHGVGHGILAHAEYDVPHAIDLCSVLGTDISGSLDRRFTSAWQECIGGVVMELIQGVHDEVAWEKMWPTYLPPDDVYMPCTASFMPPYARPACYLSLTQRFFIDTRAPRENPLPNTYAPAMSRCHGVTDNTSRSACFAGFGKEFVFYATQQDGGEVENLSDDALTSIHTWCAWAEEKDGVSACTQMALDTLFWGGQNTLDSAQSFCRVAPEDVRAACYAGLIENGTHFLDETAYEKLCSAIPTPYQADCRSEAFAPGS